MVSIKLFNIFYFRFLWLKEKYTRKSYVYDTNWGAEQDSNQLSGKEAWNGLYFVSVAIASKLVQEGEPNKTGTKRFSVKAGFTF